MTFRLTNYVMKTDDVKLNTKQFQLYKMPTFSKKKKQNICLIHTTLCSYSSRPNLENEYVHFTFLAINTENIGSWKLQNHALCQPLAWTNSKCIGVTYHVTIFIFYIIIPHVNSPYKTSIDERLIFYIVIWLERILSPDCQICLHKSLCLPGNWS